jgi:probable phosphoglycerate mutase
MAMTTLLLIRHGHVEGIQPERFRGRAELALTPLGVRQAEATRDRIAATWRPAAIHCSPMDRCVRTAQIIAEPRGLSVERHPDLNDVDYGLWQGRTQTEVRQDWPVESSLWHVAPQQLTIPGGESLHDVVARAVRALHAILSAHAGQTVAVIAHDSVNRVLLLYMLDLPVSRYWTLAQAPCAINLIEFDHGRFGVQSLNDHSHCPQV